MAGEKLSKEAEEFIKEKTRKYTSAEKTALRFYFGNAVAGLLNDPQFRQRPTELLEQAFFYAEEMFKFEEKRF